MPCAVPKSIEDALMLSDPGPATWMPPTVPPIGASLLLSAYNSLMMPCIYRCFRVVVLLGFLTTVFRSTFSSFVSSFR